MENKKNRQTVNTPANYLNRIISGAVILILLVGFFGLRILSDYVFDVLIAGIMVVSAIEVENLLHKMDRPTHPIAICLYPVLLFLCMSIITGADTGLNCYHYILLSVGIMVVLALILFIYPLIFQSWGNKLKTKDGYNGTLLQYSFAKMLNTVFVWLWPTFFMSFMFIINHFGSLNVSDFVNTYANPSNGVDFGLLGLVFLFVTTIFADTSAMLAGRFIGGPKINLEKLGPGKSWVGLIGGIVGAIVASLIVFLIFNSFDSYSNLFNSRVTIFTFLLGGLFAGLFCMGGDIFSSLFKRRAVVKDYSTLIPGHGGVMDRCNGLLANALFVFVFFIILFG